MWYKPTRKNKTENKIERIQTCKQNEKGRKEKVVESAESFMELAFKKGRELNKIPNQSPWNHAATGHKRRPELSP